MTEYKAEGMFWDFNGIIVKGYPEITAAYRMLFHSLNEMNFPRFYKLLTKSQPECWKLVRESRLDNLAYVFMKDVLAGEDFIFIRDYMRKHPIEDTLTNEILSKVKGIGKKIDAKVNKGVQEVTRELSKSGTHNYVYSSSFVPIIEGTLDRNGLSDHFSGIIANEIKTGKGYRVTDYVHDSEGNRIEDAFEVDPEDKSRTFHKALVKIGLRRNGDDVAYIGDSEPDREILVKGVEYPFVAPIAKQEFKDRCRDENPDVVVLDDIMGIPRHLEGKKSFHFLSE